MKIPWEMSRDNFVAVVCCILCSFLMTIAIMTVSCTVGYIRDGTGASEAAVSSFTRITTVSCIIFFLLSIAITDKFGKKRSMMWGLAIVCVTSVLCAMTNDLKVMTAFRLICGGGLALISTSCLSILTDNVDKKYLGEAMALYFSFNSLGAIFTPFLGPFMAETMGIGALFILPAIIAFLIIIPLRKVENVTVNPGLRIDLPVNIVYLISTILIFSAMLYPMNTGREIVLIIGIALFFLFVFLYSRSGDKTFDVKIFKNKMFTMSLVLAFVVTFCAMGVENSMSQLFQFAGADIHAFGLTISMVVFASFLTALRPAIQTLISPIIGKHYRGKDTKNVMLIGIILLLASCFLAMVTTRANSGDILLIFSVGVYVLHAVTMSVFIPFNKESMMASVEEDQRNIASSFSSVASTLASVSGTIILVNMINDCSSLSSFREATIFLFAVVFVVAIIGLLIALKRRRMADAS